MRGASHGDFILVMVPHPIVKAAQIANGAVHGAVMHAPSVNERLFPEQNMAVAVIGDLVSLIEHTPDKAVIVNRAAVFVLMNVGVVVVTNAAPCRGAFFPGLVGVVHPGIADNVKGTLGVKLGEGVENQIG